MGKMSESKKFNTFCAELSQLCLKHKIQITVSYHDNLQLWDLKDGDEYIYGGETAQLFIEDKTEVQR